MASAYDEALAELRTVKGQLRTLRDTQQYLADMDATVTPEVSDTIDKLEKIHAHLYIAVRELRAANVIKLQL